MDLSRRDNLAEEILELGYRSDGDNIVAVTLDAFFEGNDDTASLARYLDPHPGMEALYFFLHRFASENGVEVYVAIDEFDEDDEDQWPRSDRVYLIGDVESQKLDALLLSVMASRFDQLDELEINGEVFEQVTELCWD